MNVTENASAVITYGDTAALAGTVKTIKRNADKSVRLVGITPDGTDHVAWFAPAPDFAGFVSVGGSTVAYV